MKPDSLLELFIRTLIFAALTATHVGLIARDVLPAVRAGLRLPGRR